ncbi:MAG: hypothetical protein HKM04_00665 [Legionellales bacterium]|nr:hypothetical protein [Legionellales bacterium]
MKIFFEQMHHLPIEKQETLWCIVIQIMTLNGLFRSLSYDSTMNKKTKKLILNSDPEKIFIDKTLERFFSVFDKYYSDTSKQKKSSRECYADKTPIIQQDNKKDDCEIVSYTLVIGDDISMVLGLLNDLAAVLNFNPHLRLKALPRGLLQMKCTRGVLKLASLALQQRLESFVMPAPKKLVNMEIASHHNTLHFPKEFIIPEYVTLPPKALLEMIAANISNQTENNYFYGPLPWKESERKLSQIINNILDSNKRVATYYNSSGELNIYWDESEHYNITEILSDEPCFAHIKIAKRTHKHYLSYLNTSSLDKLKSDLLGFFAVNVAERERLNGIDPCLLVMSEKIALFLYTTQHYQKFNSFLRDFEIKKNNNFSSQEIVFILSTIIIASSGLTKLNLVEHTDQIYRIEGKLPDNELRRRQSHFFENSPLVVRGFFSGSDIRKDSSFQCHNYSQSHILINKNTESKSIIPYSALPKENEFLSMPNSRFSVLFYKQNACTDYYVLTPVSRTLPSPKDNRRTAVVSQSL